MVCKCHMWIVKRGFPTSKIIWCPNQDFNINILLKIKNLFNSYHHTSFYLIYSQCRHTHTHTLPLTIKEIYIQKPLHLFLFISIARHITLINDLLCVYVCVCMYKNQNNKTLSYILCNQATLQMMKNIQITHSSL